MKKNSGTIAIYTNKEGQESKCTVMRYDQKPEFIKKKKVFIRLIDEQFNPIVEDGKQKTNLVGAERLRVIGYVD